MQKPIGHMLKALTLSVAVNALCAEFVYANNYGTVVTNVADISFNIGPTTVITQTNEAVFTIEPPEATPTIEFFRYSPNAASPSMVQVNGSDYSPSSALSGPFTSTGAPLSTGSLIDLSVPIPVIPADTYLTGELMFVQVEYIAGNTDSSAIDTVVITVDADNGDTITLRLYESGPNTGVFWAYLPSTGAATPTDDAFITTGNNTQLTATFVDAARSTTAVVDSALVNPMNTVFNSITGAPIDGASIQLIDLNTGAAASVFGVDGFSEFPATLISGDTVTDDSGLVYSHTPGTFSFPHIGPGNYAIEVIPPTGYTFASSLTPSAINASTGAAYFIIDASYGGDYLVSDPSSLRFDIPLDPRSELAVTKTVDRQYADVGDFVNYTITVQNSGDSSVPVTVSDTLPIGFRYVEGTSRRDDVLIADPAVSANATHLSFPMGILGPNESVEIDYALEIGPGGFVGDAINRAIVLDGAGNALSNIARAKVNLREDLLRSTSTIVGRITENSCDASEEWAREIQRGDGVQGVRIYTETGAYAVSDPDGLFHFEGVTEGTHVIQIDEETLPAGFEAMHCEENTRYAGSNISKFVDVQGGGIWRANFYLRRTGEEFTQSVDEQQLVDQTEYKNYDQAWLATQTSEPEWVYPIGTPSIPSANLGIKHGAGEKVSLVLNGSPVSALNFEARDSDPSRKIFISRWRGVDLLEGANRFDVTVTNEAGQIVKRFSHDLHFVKDVERAYGVPDKSVLIADGRTTPEVAVRLEDAAGNPVHAGRIVEIDVVDPYRLETDMRLENSEELLAPLSARANVNVGVDGIARVKLEPTLQTGKVTVNVKLDNGRIVPIYMYLEPEKRDWIIVGLAEGSAGYETVKDKSISLTDTESDTVTDGRVAFFAKGLIKGNWLLTLAVDTDKRRTGRDGDFLEEIDPNAYYTLYGDRSYQEYEAQSRYPVYVKLEKKSAYALFGDFDTNITEGRLSSYNRRLSGLKAEYVGENFQVLGFAAETNQGFAKDEIAADGTSGTYQLSNRNILAQSESIVVETRDRHRPDIILDRRQMVRYLDYTLDYLTGEMIFRLPIDATDSEFNPNVIVADYETSEDAERNLTYGGRAQAQLMNGRVQVGSSFVSENGSALTTGSKQVMVGVDAVAQVTDNTELRVEYAVTEDKSTAGSSPAEAMLAEVIHTSGDVSAQAYFRQEDGGFGLGQTGSNTNDIRRYGVIGNVKINEFENEETGQRGRQTIEATAYREDNLGTGESRDTGEIMLRHQGDRLTVGAGVRASRDELVSQPNRESVIAIAQASLSVPKHGATFQLSHEQPLQGKDEVSAYPQRTTLGVDKTIGDKAVVTVRHEILKGATTNSDNTVFGLSVTPWTGSSVTASSDLVTGDSGRRLGATIGLDQQIKLTDKWSASAGLRNRRILDDQGDFVEVTPDAAISPFETNDDFTSAYVGLGYNTDATAITTRIEGRDASSGKTLIASGSVARELTEQLSLAGAVRGTIREDVGPSSQNVATSQVDARLGASWRPRGEKTVVFNRFDYGFQKDIMGESRAKLVNNLAVNHMVSDKWQLSANHGIKYVQEEIAGQKLNTLNNLVGLETRYDLTKKIDIGLRGAAMIGDRGNMYYSYGPSIGVSPVKNVWVSAGYNFAGFKDDDFEAAEYSREGVYLQMRIKFDQNTARGLLRRISPSSPVDARNP